MIPNLLVISSDFVEFSNVLSIIIVIIFLTFTSIILMRIWQREILNTRHDINNLKIGLKDLRSLNMTPVQSPFTISLDDKFISNFNDGCYLKTHCNQDALLWPLWGVSSSHLFEMLNHPWEKWNSHLTNKSFINCLYQGEPISLGNGPLDDCQQALQSQEQVTMSCQNTHVKRPKFLKEELLGTAPRTRYPLVLVTVQQRNLTINEAEGGAIKSCRTKSRRRAVGRPTIDTPFSDSETENYTAALSGGMVTRSQDTSSGVPLSSSQSQMLGSSLGPDASPFSHPKMAKFTAPGATSKSCPIVASVSIIHLQDSISPQPSSIMGQYLKAYDGSIYILQQLYVVSPDNGGVETSDPNASCCNTDIAAAPRPSRKRNAPARVCIVCGNRQADQVILPCRHVCLCKNCLQKLDKCPMCRGPVQSFWVMR